MLDYSANPDFEDAARPDCSAEEPAISGCGERTPPRVDIDGCEDVTRRAVSWSGMAVEIVEADGGGRIDVSFHSNWHLVVIHERGARRAGETAVEGLARSALRETAGKVTFVPAGHRYREWHVPRTVMRMIFVHVDPLRRVAADLATPRLLFEDQMMLAAALRLSGMVENLADGDGPYLDVLGAVLVHELRRLERGGPARNSQARGGLAAWQQRVVTAHIEEHLADQIPLSELAGLARLSAYHFARAFKQSFGVPPHRYHIARRIERAKSLLLNSDMSVTEIGVALGFSETSGFTATFRKFSGVTPTAFSRSHCQQPA